MKKIIFILILSLALVACKNNNEANNKVNIRFSTWDSEESLDLQQKLVDEFNEQSEEIFVTLEAYGGDYDTKITAGMGSKDAPDVMYMWNYPQYKDALEPLDAYIDKEGQEFKNDYYEALWNYNSIGDVILGMPVGFTTHVVYYNKDLFDLNGIDYPDGTWTWDELETVAEKITNEEKNHVGIALSGKPDPYDFEMFLWGNNAAYTENNKVKGALDSDESIEVFKQLQNMIVSGSAMSAEGSGSRDMETGNVGMFIYGSWSISKFNEVGLNFGVTEIPSRNGNNGVSIISSSGLAMSKYSEHKDEAFEFIKFWTGEQGNLSRFEYELPVLKSIVEDKDLQNDPIKGPFYKMLVKSEAFTPSSFTYDGWSELSSELSLTFEKIFNPTSLEDPTKALKEAADQ